MQVAVILTMLCALVHATTAEGVPVEIKLGDGTVLGHTLDTVDFGYIESHASFEEKKSEQDRKQLKVQLEMISDEDMLARLKKCWDSDMTDSDEDIDADTFYNFIRAADYLVLRGDKYKRFARNMVRKGVLGKHSMTIVRQPLDVEYASCLQRIAGQILIALASECGYEVRVVKRDDHKTEVTLCSVDDGKAESYGDICSVLETRLAIDRLSVRCNILSDTADRMEILTWLTDHLEVALLWIGSELRMTKEDTQNIVKWSEGTTHTRLGLWLDLSGYKQPSYWFVKTIITWCLSLITSRYKQPSYSFVENLIPTIPALEELHIRGVAFEPSAAHVFGQCKRLEKLRIDGCCQTSSFVSALLPNLTSIRELTINVEVLSTDAAEAFGQCKGLEKLDFGRFYQDSSFVSALLPNLTSIRELRIDVEVLGIDTVKAFGECKRLEKLYLIGSKQTSPFVSALMPSLTNIRELTIDVEELSSDSVAVFGQCKELEKLDFGRHGSSQNSSFVSALMPNITNIRELWIKVDMLSTDTAMAFGQCKGLEKLYLHGHSQNSLFVSALMPNLPNIRELTVSVGDLSADAAVAFGQCKQLEKLHPIGWQTSSFVSVLMPNLTSIRELTIWIGALSPEDAEAFRQCRRLEKLIVNGSLAPGCVERILSSPHMESLRYLGVDRVMGGPSSGDKKAIDEALKRHVVVILDE